MSLHMVHIVDGRYQVYRSEDAIHRTNVGPKWSTPREAYDFADKCDAMPQVSPLRSDPRTPAVDAMTLGDVDSDRPASEAPTRAPGSPPPDRLRDMDGLPAGPESASQGFWPG